jgi:hypothetical protein
MGRSSVNKQVVEWTNLKSGMTALVLGEERDSCGDPLAPLDPFIFLSKHQNPIVFHLFQNQIFNRFVINFQILHRGRDPETEHFS